MHWYVIALWALLGFLLLNVLLTMILAGILYTIVLVRTSPRKWSREDPEIIDDLQKQIYGEGDSWFAENRDRMKDAEIVSDGYRLAGEYYDYGGKTAVIVVPGRMETVRYSHYYAQALRGTGANILLIDNRAHGHSEGHRTALGFREYRDVIRWAELLHDHFGNEAVVLYGLCIGCETCLFAATSEEAPDYIRGIITDGMFGRFSDSFKLHITERKHKAFPVLYEVMFLEWLFTGAKALTNGPFKRILKMRRPILFLHSREDQYSEPEVTEKMYADCPSPGKRIVWFPEGKHSRIRLKDSGRYDAAIAEFIRSLEE